VCIRLFAYSLKRLYLWEQMEIELTKDIDHEGYYADEVVAQIKSIPKGEVLRMLITSNGGSTTHGDRIYRAVLEHSGKTEAVVIGRAASMAASLLSAFDKVTIDPGAELMFHKAHIDGIDGEELTPEQIGIINRFNLKTYQRMKERGVDAKFLSDVFLSETAENYWMTADEAEDLGIGKVDKVDRSKYAENYKAAALFKNENKKGNEMDIFKKVVPQVVALADGRLVIFESKTKDLKVGNTLVLAGSSEKLSGKINLVGNVVAELDEEGKVINMETVEPVNIDQTAEIEALKAEIAEIKKMLMELAGGKPEVETEAQAEADKKVEAANDLLAKALEAVNTIKSTFMPPKVENKTETVAQASFAGLSESEKRAIEMKKAVSAI